MKKFFLSVGVLALLGAGCLATPNVPSPSGDGQAMANVPVGETFELQQFDPLKPVESPLTLKGRALGNMYFEASFPVEILDAGQRVIAQSYAEAQSEWMTEDWVPFVSTITFPKQRSGTKGFIRLRNDNPSGIPDKDITGIVSIIFK